MNSKLLINALDAMSSQVAILDNHANIQFVNLAWRKFGNENGMPADYDCLGVNYLDICGCTPENETAQTVTTGIRDILLGKKNHFFIGYPCDAPDQKRWFQLRANGFEQNQEQWVVVTHENVTELERTRQYQSRLFHMMSHDLKLPLNTFVGYANFYQYQEEPPTPEETIEIMEQYNKASVHMLAIVNNMLGLGRMEHGFFDLVKTTTSFSKVIQEAKAICHPLFEGKDIEFEIQASDIEISMDINKIRQVVINLLGNAIKFTQDGKISIRTYENDQGLVCEIEDTGCGIPADKTESIFNIYEQTLQGMEHNGTGLGLSMSKKIIELHSGTIGVNSILNEGSTFYFTLPKAIAY